jgi:O-acetyl-ADP-ribose deacetylase (regulator of RNase III)
MTRLKIIKTVGNIFDTPADIICNAVNCTGTMGGGIAAKFRYFFPDMFTEYRAACLNGKVRIGQGHYYKMTVPETKWSVIANVPTMHYPGSRADINDIDASLRDLFAYMQRENYTTVAMPYLGTGVGGMDPERLEKLLETYELDKEITVVLVKYA